MVTGQNTSDSLYGTNEYGDYGLLSVGSVSGSLSEPPYNTPFPAYYGLQMLSKFARSGDCLISATSSQSLVAVYAVQQRNGQIAVLLVNTDPSTTYTVSFAGNGPVGDAQMFTYGEGSTQITQQTLHHLSSLSLQPYSLTTLVFSAEG
jgi:hypothetical protein